MGEIQFERISIESGLSQSSVLCIYQDSMDFLWFGTYEGLNRYDGYTFKVYKNDPENPFSLSNNNIEAIIEDHLGVLWIGTEDGLNRFDREKEQFIRYKNNPNDPGSLSNNYVRSIYEDRSGILWIGTQGGGLNQFDRKKDKFIHYINNPSNPKSLSQNNVLSILEDRHGRLWIGTDYGLNYFDRETKEFTRYVNDPQNPHSISPNGVWRIYEDRSGNLWIGTWGGGLNRFDPQKNRFVRYQNNPNDPNSLSNNIVRSIHEDRSGNLWIGTYGGGLSRFVAGSQGGDNGRFIHYQNNPQDPTSLSGNSVLSIFEDQLGILWIGTNFNGINKYNLGKRQFVLYKNHPNDVNSLSMNTINTIYEDSEGMIWIGTNGGGLDRLDRKKIRFTHYVYNPQDPNSLSNNMIRSVYEDRYNRLWIGTENGLNYFNRKKGKFIRYQNDSNNPHSISNNNAWSIYEDWAGNLWVGTFGGGLNRFDYAKGEFTRYVHDQNDPKSISDNFIWTMYEDSSGIFWIGTLTGGLNRFDPEKGTFFHYQSDYQNSYSISDNKVICLYEDRTGTIWLGTSNGLNKFDRNAGTFRRYSESDGLPNNSVQGILEDDHGNLWIGTNHGLSKFNPTTGRYKNYFENYGLQGNEFSTNACFRSRSGEMIFGGVHGFNIFHPDSIIDDPSLPKVVITDFQIFNKPVAIGENAEGRTILAKSISDCNEIHLSYKDNVFSFEFAGLHYVSPKGNLYAYMMEGFEKEWNYTDANRRFVTYTNLPGGTYTFRVKASNNQGRWNEKGTSIRVIITPPFWETIWFYGLLIIVLGAIVYWVFQWRVQARDLVAQRRMEVAITKERNLLRTLIDNLPDAVFVKDLECRKIIANPVDVRCMGAQSEAEVIGKTDHVFFSADTAATSFAEDQSVIQSGIPILGREGYYFDKQGNKLNVLSFKIPLRDEHGTIVGIVGSTHDITEQKRAQEALQQERTILRTLIDNIPDAIYVKDVQCRKVTANLADVHNMGLQSEDEVLGKDDFELFPKELAEGFIADDRTVIQTGQPVINREEYVLDEQGQKRWLVTSKLPLLDEKGQTIGLVGIGRDITERKKAEIERERLITELQDALTDVKLLSGLVPICASCKKIRDDQGYWTQIESYIQDRSDAKFSHSICPDCAAKLYPGYSAAKK
jgi:PAS domain S-box-containing protein